MFAEGDPTTQIFRVETGAIALYKILTDGRRQIVGFAYPGDLIGLCAQGEHVMNAQAIKSTRLRPSDFELPMTRADIGDFLGLTIETVSRTFSKLKALGLIELPHSNRVKLVDIDELESLAHGEGP